MATMEWTCVWNGVKTVRKAGVLTSQLLLSVQIGRDIDDFWLDGNLVQRGSRQHPAVGGTIPGLATMEWSCVWNGVKMVRKAGCPFRNF